MQRNRFDDGFAADEFVKRILLHLVRAISMSSLEDSSIHVEKGKCTLSVLDAVHLEWAELDHEARLAQLGASSDAWLGGVDWAKPYAF